MNTLRLMGSVSIRILVVLGVVMSSSCDPLGIYERIDIYIMNCSMDNIRIQGFGTNLHVDRDASCAAGNKQYLTTLDANITTKLFTLERSVGGCQAHLNLELTDDALNSFNDPNDEKCGDDINVKLFEDPRGVFTVQNSNTFCLTARIQDCP